MTGQKGTEQKQKIREELQKLKGMTWKQRIGYLWDYYKMFLVLFLVIVICIDIVVTTIQGLRTEELLNGVFFNCDYLAYYEKNDGGIERAYINYLGGLEDHQQLSFDFTMEMSQDVWDSERMSIDSRLTAYNMNGDLDFMVMPESVYEIFLERGWYLPLEQVLSEEEQEQWQDYLVRGVIGEADQESVSAVRVEDSELLKKYGLYGDEPVYFAIANGTKAKEETLRFLHFLVDSIS